MALLEANNSGDPRKFVRNHEVLCAKLFFLIFDRGMEVVCFSVAFFVMGLCNCYLLLSFVSLSPPPMFFRETRYCIIYFLYSSSAVIWTMHPDACFFFVFITYRSGRAIAQVRSKTIEASNVDSKNGLYSCKSRPLNCLIWIPGMTDWSP